MRSLIAGDSPLAEVLEAVSDGGGWPVPTASGGTLFVAEHAGDALSVAGDFDDWAGTAMTAGADFWWAEVAIAEPSGTLYKFKNGETFWADPWARSYTFDAFGETSLVQADITGHYARFRGVSDGTLLPRTVRIRVPLGVGPWPVLYVQDGQNLFEAGGAFGSWHLEDATGVDSALLVGIDSTADRTAEYTHENDSLDGVAVSALGDSYADFVLDTVRPRVEETFLTTDVAGVMGSSLGGLISLHMAQRDPGEWDYVASLSGTLGWGRFEQSNPIMQEVYAGRTDLGDLVVYVDSGGTDGGDGCNDVNEDGFVEDDANDSDNYCVNRAFADALAEDGFVWDTSLFHWHETGAGHNEGAWGARVSRPLGYFLDVASE